MVLKQTCTVTSPKINSAGFTSQTISLETPSVPQNDAGCVSSRPTTRKRPIEGHTLTKSKDSDHNISYTEPQSKSTIKTASPSGGRRYIAFVGNLPFTATREDIIEHFLKKGVRVTELRLLTKKGSDESRGCCFLEFPNAKTLQASHNNIVVCVCVCVCVCVSTLYII